MTLPVDPARYLAFLVAMAMMALSPGPANLYFVRTGLSGQKAAVVAGLLGVNTATLVWFIAASLGLSVLMHNFPTIFQLIAVAGGLYLVWLGYKTLSKAGKGQSLSFETIEEDQSSLMTKAMSGFMVQILNPKALLFFSAVLPPFLDLSRPMGPQMFVFGATTIGMDIMAMSAYGFGAMTLKTLLSQETYRRLFDQAVGLIVMAIGLAICYHAALAMIKPH